MSVKMMVALLTLSACGAQAADLKTCISLAQQNSPLLKAYESKLAASASAYEKDKKAGLPQITGSAGAGYYQYGDEADLSNGVAAQVAVAVNWDLEKYSAKIANLSAIELERNGLLKTMAQNQIAQDVSVDYYKLYVLEGKKADYAAAATYFETHIKDIDRLQSAGVDVKLDLIRAGMQLKTLRAEAEDLQGDIDETLLSLNSATGGALKETGLDFSALPDPKDQTAQVALPSAETLYPAKLDELDTKSALESSRQSEYNNMPSLQFGVERNVHAMDPNTEQYHGYVALNFNIFDYGAHLRERDELKKTAQYQSDAARDNLKKLQLSVAQLAQEIKLSANACLRARETLSDANASLDTAALYYRQGKIKETDLLSTFSDYFEVQKKTRDTLDEYLSKKNQFDHLLGSAK
jgi:outer membrane protein TolC